MGTITAVIGSLVVLAIVLAFVFSRRRTGAGDRHDVGPNLSDEAAPPDAGSHQGSFTRPEDVRKAS